MNLKITPKAMEMIQTRGNSIVVTIAKIVCYS